MVSYTIINGAFYCYYRRRSKITVQGYVIGSVRYTRADVFRGCWPVNMNGFGSGKTVPLSLKISSEEESLSAELRGTRPPYFT